MIPNIKLLIGARSDVPNWHDENLQYLVSIRDADVKMPYMEHFARKPTILKLIFEDVCHQCSTSVTEDDIVKLINFCNMVKSEFDNGKVINIGFNCYAGQSRSTAAAFIFLNIINPDKEEENFKYLLECRDCAVPNTLMVDFADKLLGKNGKISSITRLHRNNFLINNAWVPKNEQTN